MNKNLNYLINILLEIHSFKMIFKSYTGNLPVFWFTTEMILLFLYLTSVTVIEFKVGYDFLHILCDSLLVQKAESQ